MDSRRAQRTAAEKLEQGANALREAHLQWNGSAYVWPRSAQKVRRLHDSMLDGATALRELMR